MHLQARDAIRNMVRDSVAGKRVLEIGSYNVNGTIADLFSEAEAYDGLDSREGPGVNIVADARSWRSQKRYDIVVSCETLEHTDDPAAILKTAHHVLEAGGYLLLTAAAPERIPHGIDGGALGREQYTAIEPAQLQTWLSDVGFIDVHVTHRPDIGDVYAQARKPEEERPAAKKASERTVAKKADEPMHIVARPEPEPTIGG